MSDQEALNSKRQWQAQIWIDSEKTDPPTIIYGETIADLKAAVSAYIIQANPQKTVIVADNVYTYTDGSTFLPEHPVDKRRRIATGEDQEPAEKGWYTEAYGRYYETGTLQELIIELLKIPELIEKGPSYKDPTIVDGVFQLATIHITKRTDSERQINEALRRGWHILKITEGDTYHLGHEDPDAL